MKDGSIESSEDQTEKFLERARELFPIAIDFKPFFEDSPEVIDTNEDSIKNVN